MPASTMIQSAWDYARASSKEFSKDRVLQLSAAVAYYATFSIGPLLVLVIGIGSLVMSQQATQHQVHDQLQKLFGPKTASTLNSMIGAGHSGGGLAATILRAIGLALGATGLFVQLQQSLNIIWDVEQRPSAGIWGYLLNRGLSMLMVLAIGLLLLVSMVLSAFITSLSGGSSLPNWAWHVFNELLWFALVTGFFGLIFKHLPLVKIKWGDVWRGALVTSALFVIGKYLLGLYLGTIGAKSSYGAASSFVVFLRLVYYAAVIFFFGAEFTKVRAEKTGSEILPNRYAVRVPALQSTEQGRPSPEQLRRAEEQRRKQPPPDEHREAA
jgi:membrane protein